uniref:Uncharacterized protein n=1 Tax=Ciona intestinalis TaxID=7719 RepID=H2XPD3_CIOIN
MYKQVICTKRQLEFFSLAPSFVCPSFCLLVQYTETYIW